MTFKLVLNPSSAKSHDFVCFFKVLEKLDTCQKSPYFFRDVFRIKKVSRVTKIIK
jgi:hypothetical protein